MEKLVPSSQNWWNNRCKVKQVDDITNAGLLFCNIFIGLKARHDSLLSNRQTIDATHLYQTRNM